MSDFGFMAGVACIIFALLFPLAYCTAKNGGPVTPRDLELACINGRGEWKAEGAFSAYTCHWPKPEAAK